MWRRIRNYFITGLIVLLPLVVSIYVLRLMFFWLDGLMAGMVQAMLHRTIPGLGLAMTIGVVFLVGVLATNYLGKRLISLGELVLARIPVVGGLYLATKQVLNTLVEQEQGAFRRVVLVEYPRKGAYAIGFATGSPKEDRRLVSGHKLVKVFVPTTPNPTSGFLLLLDQEEVKFLDMSVEDGLKLVVSGGLIEPK